MKKEPLIIGLIGKPGSGKTTIVNLLQNIAGAPQSRGSARVRIATLRFSDVPRELLKKAGQEVTRENLQKFVQEMVAKEGADALSRRIRARISALAEDSDIVIADGVRWHADVEMIRSFKKSKLLYVHAPARTRHARIIARAKENAGDDTKILAQFLKEDRAENERHVAKLGRNADFAIDNGKTEKELRARIAKFLAKHCGIM